MRIVAPGTLTPLLQLLGQISGRLAAERRVGRAGALAMNPVAGSTGGKPPGRITMVIKPDRFNCAGGARNVRHVGPQGVVSRHRILLNRRQLPRNRFHFGMAATTACIGFELRGHVAAVEAGEPRRARAVTLSV
ncbi:hypothetical protein M529_18605 [Sphingobium ummariense RL-3]|uniref:Uncharacterized protein n=1 Tax=Sphingobium ummariense RL-3 TaxID=1346791 RepID=T0IYD6_9SPHN|nr:hypothetical protein [Sphingobium ummariense]EQB30756.1 hypothetical protein M529_18605 [Sphingobium ummariense RL-3]